MVKITLNTNHDRFFNEKGYTSSEIRNLELAKIMEKLAKQLRDDAQRGIIDDNFIITDEQGKTLGTFAYLPGLEFK